MGMYTDVKNLVKKFIDSPLRAIAVAYLIYSILKKEVVVKESYKEKLEVLYDNK